MLHGAQDERAGGLDAADDLDDDVGAGDEVLGVGREEARGRGRGRRGRGRRGARRCRRSPAGAPTRAARSSRVLGEQAGDGGAHDAAAEQGDAQRSSGLTALSTASNPAVCPPDRDGHCFAIRTSAARSAQSAPDVEGEQVVDGLAAHEDPCAAVPHGDHRRPRGVVVLARQRPAVGAGARARRCRSPAATSAGRNSSLTTMSPLSQCLPDDAGQRAVAPSEVRLGQRAGVVGVVERGADVVAHAAVDGDVDARRRRRRGRPS